MGSDVERWPCVHVERTASNDILKIANVEILAQMHRLVINMDIPAREKVELMDRIGEADYRITEGANERIQLDALIASFCLSSGGHNLKIK
ncbi:Replication factor C small subunit [ANME-1 cluster archaeon GoMg1]|nr:Replication factor C small subunit [ANME-1 cluster archaeon GoMg1]